MAGDMGSSSSSNTAAGTASNSNNKEAGTTSPRRTRTATSLPTRRRPTASPLLAVAVAPRPGTKPRTASPR